MTPQQIQLLNRACMMAGVDSKKIRPENPFTKSGMTAGLIQAAIAELDPAQAARWRVDAGGALSVATMAELQSGLELSEAAKSDLWNHDADFVGEFQQQKQKKEADQLAWMEKEADRMRREREGDQKVNEQLAREASAKQAKQESLRRHMQLQQRIDSRRAEADRLSGRFVQS